MNKVWLILLLSSVIALMFIDPSSVLSGLINASNKAVSLSFELCAIYAVWMGIFSILEQTDISKWFAKMLSPLIDLIYGKKNISLETRKYISLNMSANMLGMGGAATPLGLKAMESMQKDNPDKTSATKEMTMLVVVCCCVFQFIPSTIMSLMATAGSVNPSKIVFPSIIASLCSTTIGVICVKLYHFLPSLFKRRKKNG